MTAYAEPVEVVFTASIKLFEEDLRKAHGSVPQAVQNLIGQSGAQVLELEDA